ncbi:hypothetical protein [Streptomyces anthocyanicus]|uniref:hypothetical protein n=1 Tax=Streptomyces anthocyanicus TaxID=68174 RepID=UPI00382EB781
MDRAETHAQTVHRIFGDRRAAPPARELLLAVAYALFVAPGEPGRVLSTAARALGHSPATGRPRFDALVADDAPRYEPPRGGGRLGPGRGSGLRGAAPAAVRLPAAPTRPKRGRGGCGAASAAA